MPSARCSRSPRRGSRGKVGFRTVKSILPDVVNRIDELYHSDGKLTGIPTGFKKLDEMTSGLQPGDLIIIAGRPSMGKTTLAVNIAENAALGSNKSAAIFSMEMSAESLTLRMISSLGRINQSNLRSGRLREDDWPRIDSAMTQLSSAKIFVDETPALTPTEIRARARRLKRERGLDLIVVDYLQLMQVAGTKENRATEISEISRSLKALAKELKVPVIALSQLNRGVEQRVEKKPVMSDLRECVTGETPVMLADGRRVPIRELVGQTPEVWAMSADQKIIKAQSDLVWSKGVRQVFRVSLASGRSLRATANHRVFTGEGWRTVGRDRSRFASRCGAAISFGHQPCGLVGCGDLAAGSLGRRRQLPHAPAAALHHGFGSKQSIGHRVRDGARQHRDAACGPRQLAPARHCEQRQPLARGRRRRVVERPRDIQSAFAPKAFAARCVPTERCANRIAAQAFVGHGWLYPRSPRGPARRPGVYFCSCSEQLVRDVAALLLRLGIVGRIYQVKQDSGRPLWSVYVSGSEQQALFLARVGAFGPREAPAKVLAAKLAVTRANPNVDTLPQELYSQLRSSMSAQGLTWREIGSMRGTTYSSNKFRHSPSRATFNSYVDLLDSDALRIWSNSDLFWDRVVAVGLEGEEEVFDMTVPGSGELVG